MPACWGLAIAALVLAAPRIACAQLATDPLLPDRPHPRLTIGEIIPADAITHLQIRGIGGTAPLALIPVFPLVTTGQRSVRCDAPCEVELSPGRYQIVIDPLSSRTIGDTIDVPLAGGRLLVDVHDQRPFGNGLVAAGIASLVIGVLATTVGFASADGPAGFDLLRSGAWFPVGIAFDVATVVLFGVGGWIANTYRTRIEPVGD